MRTVLWALGIALALAAMLPALDGIGEYMGFPPSYHTSARVLVAAFWLAGVAAVWAYEPARPREPAGEPPEDGGDGASGASAP